jgi:anti-sigma28 factor (negative regulator of flagellin synthesis)
LNGKDAGVDSDAESVLGKYSRDEYTVGSEEHARHSVDRTQELLARIQKVEEERKEIEDGELSWASHAVFPPCVYAASALVLCRGARPRGCIWNLGAG